MAAFNGVYTLKQLETMAAIAEAFTEAFQNTNRKLVGVYIDDEGKYRINYTGEKLDINFNHIVS